MFGVFGGNLKSNHTQSCGCLQKELASLANKTHGKRKHPLYGTWVKMKQRCYNPNNKDYKYYGARGIRVCTRWLDSFENFLFDIFYCLIVITYFIIPSIV